MLKSLKSFADKLPKASKRIDTDHVVLCEAADELGGALRVACVPIAKQELTKVVQFMAHRIEAAGVDIRLNTPVTKEMLEGEFAGYEVHKDLQAGVNGAKNYSYGLYLNGMPRAMIMVCNNGVHHSIKSERLAEQASLSYGVPYMNFFAHLPNEKEYIANRLKENIR